MDTRMIEKLKDKLCEELEKVSRKSSMSQTDLDQIHKLTDSIKNLDKIEMLEGEGESEDSYRRGRSNGSYGNGNYSRESYGYENSRTGRMSYDDGGDSYARRGMHYVRGHYSRDDGMSERIEELMHDSRMNAEDKDTLRRALDVLRK